MKRAFVVALLAAAMLMAFTSSAFALHGAYNSTGASCAECHSVHDATGGASQNLFMKAPTGTAWSAQAGATQVGGPGLAYTGTSDYVNANTEALCEYCHVYGGHVINQVYGAGLQGNSSTMSSHAIGASTAPNSSGAFALKGDGAGHLGCVDCHNALPHAAGSGKTWTSSNSNLRMAGPDGKVVNLYSQDTTGSNLTVVNSFCGRCHDQNMSFTTGGTTHVLTTSTTMNTTNYGSQTVAFNTSEACTKCHAVNEFHDLQAQAGAPIQTPGGTYTATTTGTAPFNTTNEATGTAFTNYGPGKGYPASVSNEVADGICLSCHMKSDSSAGVGVSF
jgi:hypothetical protein